MEIIDIIVNARGCFIPYFVDKSVFVIFFDTCQPLMEIIDIIVNARGYFIPYFIDNSPFSLCLDSC